MKSHLTQNTGGSSRHCFGVKNERVSPPPWSTIRCKGRCLGFTSVTELRTCTAPSGVATHGTYSHLTRDSGSFGSHCFAVKNERVSAPPWSTIRRTGRCCGFTSVTELGRCTAPSDVATHGMYSHLTGDSGSFVRHCFAVKNERVGAPLWSTMRRTARLRVFMRLSEFRRCTAPIRCQDTGNELASYPSFG